MKYRGLAVALVLAVAAAGAYAHCGSCPGDQAKEKDSKACKKSACGAKAACATASEAKVDTAGLKALLDSGKTVTVLDARSGKWDDGKRIPGAKSLSASSSDADIAAALPDKNAAVVTYCGGVKCPASNALAEKLGKLGYKNVTEYPEGIEGWTKAGHPVEETKK